MIRKSLWMLSFLVGISNRLIKNIIETKNVIRHILNNILHSGGEYMVFPGVFQLGTPPPTKNSSDKIDVQELKYNLNVLNISSDTLVLIIIAIVLNLYYVYKSKVDICDTLNNTSCGKKMPDASSIPEFGNFMFLYITAVFLVINYDDYMRKLNVPCDKRDKVAITKAYNAFVAALLAYIAAVISRRNYDIDHMVESQKGNTGTQFNAI